MALRKVIQAVRAEVIVIGVQYTAPAPNKVTQQLHTGGGVEVLRRQAGVFQRIGKRCGNCGYPGCTAGIAGKKIAACLTARPEHGAQVFFGRNITVYNIGDGLAPDRRTAAAEKNTNSPTPDVPF